MSSRKWLDNAFWETEDKKELNCILELEDDIGRVTRQVMRLNQLDKEGNVNEDYEEVVEVLTEKLIDDNTSDRKVRKKQEKEEKQQRDVEHAKARKLEDLFNYKMEAFEVEEVKSSKNRKLKAKLRRAKSRIEVDMYAIMILQDSIASLWKRQRSMEKSKGIVIVASNKPNFYVYAINLIDSIRDYHEDANITLVCEPWMIDERAEDLADNIIHCDNHYRAKLWGMAKSPYDITMYIDADMECEHEDIAKVYDELGDYDVMFSELTDDRDYIYAERDFSTPEGAREVYSLWGCLSLRHDQTYCP